MRTLTVTGTSNNFSNRENGINAAKDNATFKFSESLNNNEVIIEVNHINNYFSHNSRKGTSESSCIIGTLKEKLLYKQNEIALKIEKAKLMNFEKELTIDSNNKHLLLYLVDKYGIEKMTELLQIFKEVEPPLREKEVQNNKLKKYL